MEDTGVELTGLSAYLGVSCGKIAFDGKEKVPVLKVKNSSSVKGLVTVAKYLVRSSEKKELLGDTVEDGIAIDQWLLYRVSHLSSSFQDKDISNRLKDLNTYLEDKVYMVGSHITLADILLYYGFHRIFSQLTFYEKETYMNVSRWFDNVQNDTSVRQCFPSLHFQRNYLYKGVTNH